MTYPVPDWTANAVDREAEWLVTTGDALPSLLAADSGPWDIIEAYWPANSLNTQKRGLYVCRRVIRDDHENAARYRSQYELYWKVVWPVKQASSIAQTEQRNLDAAIGLALQRVRGLIYDKTHGARFASVGEVPGVVSATVVYTDPEQTIKADRTLRAEVSYFADEFEYPG